MKLRVLLFIGFLALVILILLQVKSDLFHSRNVPPIVTQTQEKPGRFLFALSKNELSQLASAFAFSKLNQERELNTEVSSTDSCQKKMSEILQKKEFLNYNQDLLNRVAGPWFYQEKGEKVDVEESSTSGKFLLALAKADLLEGKTIEKNEEEALALLQEVRESDPNNSAPLLYIAIIEERRGNHTAVKELIRQAQQTKHFNSYILNFTQTLFGQVENSADYLEASEIWKTIPIPSYISLLDLRKFLEDSPSQHFTRQMMQGGSNSNLGLSGIHWLPLEYVVGKILMDSTQRDDASPSYKESLKENERLTAALDRQKEMNSDCFLESSEPIVDLVRSYFSGAPEK